MTDEDYWVDEQFVFKECAIKSKKSKSVYKVVFLINF